MTLQERDRSGSGISNAWMIVTSLNEKAAGQGRISRDMIAVLRSIIRGREELERSGLVSSDQSDQSEEAGSWQVLQAQLELD